MFVLISQYHKKKNYGQTLITSTFFKQPTDKFDVSLPQFGPDSMKEITKLLYQTVLGKIYKYLSLNNYL